MSTQTSPDSRDVSQGLGRILRAPMRLQTYRNLCYLMMMFPLGFVYFMLLTVGLPTAIGLTIIIIGIPIFILLLALVIGLARFEQVLIRGLLRVDISTTAVESEHDHWNRVKHLVTGLRTWKAVAYLLSEFFYGSVVIALIGSLVPTVGSFLLAPLYYKQAPVIVYGPIPSDEFTLEFLFGWNNLLVGLATTFQLGSWQIETLPGALLVTGLGIILLLVLFQLTNALARIWGRYARVMLTTPRS